MWWKPQAIQQADVYLSLVLFVFNSWFLIEITA